MPDPKGIQGNEIPSIELSEFWIKGLEVQAEMQHNVEEKCQVWWLLETSESSAADPEAEAGAEKISLEMTRYSGSGSPSDVSPRAVPQTPISSVRLPLQKLHIYKSIIMVFCSK